MLVEDGILPVHPSTLLFDVDEMIDQHSTLSFDVSEMIVDAVEIELTAKQILGLGSVSFWSRMPLEEHARLKLPLPTR